MARRCPAARGRPLPQQRPHTHRPHHGGDLLSPPRRVRDPAHAHPHPVACRMDGRLRRRRHGPSASWCQVQRRLPLWQLRYACARCARQGGGRHRRRAPRDGSHNRSPWRAVRRPCLDPRRLLRATRALRAQQARRRRLQPCLELHLQDVLPQPARLPLPRPPLQVLPRPHPLRHLLCPHRRRVPPPPLQQPQEHLDLAPGAHGVGAPPGEL
mmetsp:Transcript_27351/g.67489  ORF Transcript_27351/g.67489 Transcript_27351/m.67489 type:complete len:212 (+) Transcript_27351:506-1141(+)